MDKPELEMARALERVSNRAVDLEITLKRLRKITKGENPVVPFDQAPELWEEAEALVKELRTLGLEGRVRDR